MLSRIDHVALEVPNIDAYIFVFTETNGLKLIRKGVATATGRQIAMLGDRLGTKIELIENPECDAIRFLHVAFATNDLACALHLPGRRMGSRTRAVRDRCRQGS